MEEVIAEPEEPLLINEEGAEDFNGGISDPERDDDVVMIGIEETVRRR